MINHARREWGLGIINPVAQIRKPSQPQGRERVLNDVEMSRILHELEKINPYLKSLCEFALETAMRRGELMSLLWKNINFEKRVAFLPITKNGRSRSIPLSTKAIEILNLLPRDIEGCVFPLNKQTVSILFLRATRRAKIENFHFHDLRHMALTKLSTKFTNILELAAISGHRELRMLQRYVHIKAEDLVQKMSILLISKKDKEFAYENLPKIEKLFRVMTQKTHAALQRRMVDNLSKTADQRYVDFIEKYPQLYQRLTNLQIAAYLGISHEFLSRIRKKIISKK
jgi:integrase